jgi:hypothetical protein
MELLYSLGVYSQQKSLCLSMLIDKREIYHLFQIFIVLAAKDCL